MAGCTAYDWPATRDETCASSCRKMCGPHLFYAGVVCDADFVQLLRANYTQRLTSRGLIASCGLRRFYHTAAARALAPLTQPHRPVTVLRPLAYHRYVNIPK
jgi:hypothetical protein